MKSILNFIRRWGLLLLGILLIAAGLIYGAIPHKAAYQRMPKSFIAHYLSGRGTGYMQLEKSPTLYIVNEGEFLPAFYADYLNHGQIVISFLFRNDETTNIDVSSDNNVHLAGPAFSVAQITLYHQYGQKPVVYSSREYLLNPDGYYQHNWMAGIGLSILGMLFIGLGLLVHVLRSRKHKKLQSDTTSARTLGADTKHPEEVARFK